MAGALPACHPSFGVPLSLFGSPAPLLPFHAPARHWPDCGGSRMGKSGNIGRGPGTAQGPAFLPARLGPHPPIAVPEPVGIPMRQARRGASSVSVLCRPACLLGSSYTCILFAYFVHTRPLCTRSASGGMPAAGGTAQVVPMAPSTALPQLSWCWRRRAARQRYMYYYIAVLGRMRLIVSSSSSSAAAAESSLLRLKA